MNPIINLLLGTSARAEPAKFRTDADGPVLAKEDAAARAKAGLPDWYRLVEGQFPPEGSAHVVSGELMWVDGKPSGAQKRSILLAAPA